MVDLSKLLDISIPEGSVSKIEVKGLPIWKKSAGSDFCYRYVSLGDSIAAGHKTDETWETEYGWDSQYRQKDPITGEIRKETVIVPNCYTDRIRQYLYSVYGENRVDVKSFAVSGSMVYREPGENRTLLDVIQEEPVKKALGEADLVTISIGANTILEPALNVVQEYLMQGTGLPETEAIMEDALRVLDDPNNNKSYNELFTQLTKINPKAKVIFTTVHNPMKYLYIERGSYANDFEDGFFGEWLSWIPNEFQITMDIPLVGKIEIDKEIKKLIIDSELLVGVRDRINGNAEKGIPAITDWVERYLEWGGISANGLPYLGLNPIIRKAIRDYNNPNFVFTETHELFDTVPDRGGAGEVHYNDLVNMQISRGYDANDMPWDALWGKEEGNSPEEKQAKYWRGVFDKYLQIDWSSFTFDFDVAGFMEEFAPILRDEILSPAFDPHPRTDGHYLMYRSFADTLGWQPLNSITYNANGGSGQMAMQKVLDASLGKKIYSLLLPNRFNPQTGYYFTGWKDNNNNSYSNAQSVHITNNVTLNAQWDNHYAITYMHSNYTNGAFGDGETGNQENYELWIDGKLQDKFGAFSSSSTTFPLEYGTPIGFICKCYNPHEWFYDDQTCRIHVDGVGEVASGKPYVAWNFPGGVPGNMIIDFRWKYDISTGQIKSWDDCYITLY